MGDKGDKTEYVSKQDFDKLAESLKKILDVHSQLSDRLQTIETTTTSTSQTIKTKKKKKKNKGVKKEVPKSPFISFGNPGSGEESDDSRVSNNTQFSSISNEDDLQVIKTLLAPNFKNQD